MTRRALLAILAAALLLLAGGAAALLLWPAPDRPGAGPLAIGGPFALAAARGGTVDSRSLAGRPYALFFGFTHCPEVCPTTMSGMGALLDRLGPPARDFRVFFVTVDPERDTAEALRDYMASFDPRIEALVPTQEQLMQLARDFRVYYAKVPTAGGDYTMDHTASVFLIRADGSFFGTLGYGEADSMREAKLRRLLGGG